MKIFLTVILVLIFILSAFAILLLILLGSSLKHEQSSKTFKKDGD